MFERLEAILDALTVSIHLSDDIVNSLRQILTAAWEEHLVDISMSEVLLS